MDLVEEMPSGVLSEFKRRLNVGELTLLAVSADIRSDGMYGDSWLLATDEHVFIIDPDHAEKPTVIRVLLKDIVSVEVHHFIGNDILEIKTCDRTIEAARFSKSMTEKFNEVSSALEELKRGESVRYTREIESQKVGSEPQAKPRCEKCGRVLPSWSETCPACLQKRKIFLRLLSYVRPYWHLASLGLVLTLLLTAIGLAPPYLMKILIDRVLVPKENLHLLTWLVAGLALIYASRSGLSGLRGFLMAWLGQRIVFDLRTQVFDYLQRLSLSFYDKKQTGRLMSRVSSDTERLQDFIAEGVQDMIVSVLTLVGIGVVLFSMNWQLASLALIPIPLLALGTIVFGKKIHRVFHKVWRRWAGMSAILADVIPGIKVVKAFAQEDREIGRFRAKNKDLFQVSMGATKLWATFFPVMGFITSMGSIIVWWFGGQGVFHGTLTLGALTAFNGYMWRFYSPVQMLCRLNRRLQRAAAAAERVFEVIDTEPEIHDDWDAVSLDTIRGDIRFENASFSYDGGRPVLQRINLDVKAGEMIGLVGASGAGKTTLVNLISRFYDPTEGIVTIDGHDVRKVRLRALREQVGVVLQEPLLFHGSIAANISYGKPGATRCEIIAAAKVANAHRFIMGFPDGYDTLVGERGTRLSGGERQRISIARAILNNPRILILDEATSSVDTETEALIQEAIGRLVEGRTTFAIAHRLSTLKNADRLVVLDEGKVAEVGTHEELLERDRDGVYSRLCKLQAELSKVRVV